MVKKNACIFISGAGTNLKALIKSSREYNYPINIGNPNEISIKDFAHEIISLTGNSNQKIVFKELPENDPLKRKPDIELAKNILGWKPKIQRKEGLRLTYDYFCNLSVNV